MGMKPVRVVTKDLNAISRMEFYTSNQLVICFNSASVTFNNPTLGNRRVNSLQFGFFAYIAFNIGTALLTCLLFASVMAVQYFISKLSGNIFMAALYSFIAFSISFFSVYKSP